MYKHKIPVHLEQEEVFVWGMTGRQILIVGCGVALGYLFFTDVIGVISATWGILLAALCAGLTVSLFTFAAFKRILGRGLEQWAVIGLLFLFSPHLYLWAPLDEESEFPVLQEPSPQQKASNEVEKEIIGTQW